MKLIFDNKTISGYKEILRQTKRIQETAESVVPDVNDDIGKIASVQTGIYLKSKDVSGRNASISGEAVAALMYITENEKSVSFVKLSKAFSIDYELDSAEEEVISQVKLDILSCEARIINPRKVSVTFDISSELSCFKKQSIPVETLINPDAGDIIHARYEKSQLVYSNCVCEKTFTLSEQFVFPTGKPEPSRLLGQKLSFDISDSQLIGSKLIVKGSVGLEVCYLSDEVNYPLKTDFSTAFSQIIEMGCGEMTNCTVIVQPSSVYCDTVNTINGEKAMDAEIHAVMQICTENTMEIKYISDVYSNLMPVEFETRNDNIISSSTVQQIKLISDERLKVADDCADVLSVFTSLGQISLLQDKIKAVVTLDIVYRTKGGSLSSVKRPVILSCDCGRTPDRLLSARLADVYLRPDSSSIEAHAAVELRYLSSVEASLVRIVAAQLDEDNPYDYSSFPTLSLVRTDGEELWELAKTYHSSVEQISAVNKPGNERESRLLIIPKSI